MGELVFLKERDISKVGKILTVVRNRQAERTESWGPKEIKKMIGRTGGGGERDVRAR